DLAAFDDGRLDPGAVGAVDTQLDGAVCKQQPIAGPDRARESRERRGKMPGPAGEVAGLDRETFTRLDPNRPSAFERSGADLGTAEVLEHPDLTPGTVRRRADASERRRLRLVGAMGKIETEDISAGANQRIEHVVRIGGRSYSRDDLGVPHQELVAGS